MKPTIGRIVVYREPSSQLDKVEYQGVNGTLSHPAMITRVWSDGCVNLTVFFDASGPATRSSVTQLPKLPDGVVDTSGAGGWSWPAPANVSVINAFSAVTSLGAGMVRSEQILSEDVTTRDAAGLLVTVCGEASRDAGWHNDPKTGKPRTDAENEVMFPTRLCLIHSEISEAMEGHRKGLQDDKLPHREMAEVELADALIRICDLAYIMGFDLGGAVVEKMAFNAKRPDHKIEHRNAAGGKAY